VTEKPALPTAASRPTAALDRVLVRGERLYKIYQEGPVETVALRGATIEVGHGEHVSLVGPSGSGKSTLLRTLAGLSLPSAGRVLLDGTDITQLDEGARAHCRGQRIGLVFQRGNLIPFLTAEENVTLVQQTAGRRRSHALARTRDLLGELALTKRQTHYPRQLSGGEAQRAGIAVALANDPALLIGDEVTGELDRATSESVLAVLIKAQKHRNLAMLLVTHDATLAARADRQLRIVDGLVPAP